MEVLNDLLGYKNRKIYQNTDWFSFTLDSVLLANFVKLNLSHKKILDIGTGTGAIPLILSTKTNRVIDAIEVQENVAHLFKKSIEYNHLESQIHLIIGDVLDYAKKFNHYYDVLISNPPYYNQLKKSMTKEKLIARHEVRLCLEDLLKVSNRLLKDGGKLFLVYNSTRFLELVDQLRKYQLTPKKIQFVHQHLEKEASMVLVECIKKGKEGLQIEEPIIIDHIQRDKLYTDIVGDER